jgi:DNA-directed DNA polymerase III PolC
MQRIVTAIRKNITLDSIQNDYPISSDTHFMPPEEISVRYSDSPDAIQSVGEIIERCQPALPVSIPHLPEVETAPGISASQLLRKKAESGAIQLYGEVTPAIRLRLEHELRVIESLGYSSLFLIVEEILTFAREKGVPFSSRGSAASSLVAHCLGITSPDPLRLNLYFERFLNPARASLPDIDIDLCSRRRDEVIEFVYRKYGRERVAMVCTVNRFRRRSALREVAKAHGLSPAEISKMVESLPHRWYGPADRDNPDEQPFDELANHFPSPLHQSIFRTAYALLGVPHHLSIHPGGIVISPEAITDLTPIQLAAKGMLITQFDLDSIEQLGLVKIDLLGIRGLTVLGDVIDAINAGFDQHPRGRLGSLDDIPEEDRDTSELVRAGKTIGCFQIESPGMRLTLKEIQASSLDGVMAALALYRPGPLTGGQKDNFIRRFQGREPTSYLHPSLAPLLDDTYGVILYQEQVLRIAHQLAGLTLADADLLRRAMSHFDPGKQMQTLKEKFIKGTFELHGIPEATAEHIWELMAAFAGYGFPKAHAASYARVAWRSAWCKAHHPAIFMAAVLANWGGYYSQSNYLTEARRMGLTLKPPQVNYAQHEFSVSYLEGEPVLFMGLDQVRDLSNRTQKRILKERPFRSFEDFLTHADPRIQEAENLVKVGALEGMGTIPALLHRLSLGGWQGGQLSLFGAPDTSAEDFSIAEKAQAQEEILGASVVAHRLELFTDQISKSKALTTVDAAGRIGQQVRVAGIRQFWRRSSTSKGDAIYFMSLEDLEGTLQVVISAEVYRRCRSELRLPGPYVIEGTVEMDTRQIEPSLRAERIWAVNSQD